MVDAQPSPAPLEINARTRLFAVIGHPVAHSLGPAMHNTALAEAGINGVYAAFDVTDLAAAVSGIRAFNIAGVSVTVPHKEAVIPLLDEIDDEARRIGAVNTIVNENGKLVGRNTDAAGAVAALEQHAGDLRGRKVFVIGAGGAARAVAFGVLQKGADLHIINRSPSRGEALAAQTGARFHLLSQNGDIPDDIPADILVNTTPAGMAPYTDETPVSAALLRPGTFVMDIIYNPLQTRLLAEAEKNGCMTINGVPMFVHQGARQFTLWTGIAPPVDRMTQIVYEKLQQS